MNKKKPLWANPLVRGFLTGKIVLAIVGVVWYKKHMELISQKF